MEKRLAGKKPR